jgi:uncharacterized protein DUF3187
MTRMRWRSLPGSPAPLGVLQGLLPSILLGALGSCALIPARSSDPAPRVRGPIPSRMQHPIGLTYLAFRPRRAATQPEGQLGVTVHSAYSSLFQNEQSASENVIFDGELLSPGVIARYGLDARSDIQIECTALYASSGFLDAFVESWHEFFGLPLGNRDSRPHGEFDMLVEQNGRQLYELEDNRLGLLDVPIVWTRSLVLESASTPGVAMRLGVELPAGSESAGFSNGALDWGAGLLFEQSRDRWTFTGAADYVATGRPSSFAAADIDATDLWDAQAGAEYRWNDRLSLLGELIFTSSLLPEISLDQLHSPLLDLGLGAAWDTSAASRFFFSFHEDLLSEAGPDFGALLGWSWRM